MYTRNQDTIVALATPPGKGGVGIIRISGKNLEDTALKILQKIPSPRQAEYLPFFDKQDDVIDIGIALYFKAPNSFTGEDVLELHGHGGPVILDLLMQRTLECGARLAQPGEFSFRAYLNDKIDLAQAESISDLINSSTKVAARSAVRSLQGEFSQRVHRLLEQLVMTRMYVEAAIDFPEEEIDFLADETLMNRLDELKQEITNIFNATRQGSILNEGMSVVIAGQPNAGKSSLLNCLTGADTAIVTDIPGTTRDILRQHIHIDGMPLHIIDTAGLREQADIVEQEGIKRAWTEIQKADHVLLVIDDGKGFTEADEAILRQLPDNLPVTVVHNKIDISGKQSGLISNSEKTQIYLSARQKLGIDGLNKHLKQVMGYEGETDGTYIARRRHVLALEKVQQAVANGITQLKQNRAGELLAEELRLAQESLNEITGEFDNEDLLDKIFSSFCIGK